MIEPEPAENNEGRFLSALWSAPLVIFQQDRALRYTWVFKPFPGLRMEEMLGATDAAFLPVDEARALDAVKRDVLERGQPRRAVLKITVGGREHRFDLSIRPLYSEAGATVGLVGTAWDITDLPQAAGSEMRARLLASLSRSFAETGNDYPAILDTIARLVASAAGDACLIYITPSESKLRVPAAFYHADPQAVKRFQALFDGEIYLPPDQLPMHFLQENRPVSIDDFTARPDLLARLPESTADWARDFPVRAMLILPLRSGGTSFGAMVVWRSQSDSAYSADEQVFLLDVAGRASLAIENARLYADEVHRNRQLKALHDATAALLSTLDREVLLGRILDAAQSAIPAAERGVLYLVAPRTGRLEISATSGFGDPRIRRVGALQNNHANRAMRERKPIFINDTMQLIKERAKETTEENASPEDLDSFRSAIFAPLLLGEEVLGTLALSSSQPYAFDASDLQLLASFAATTTAAMHNAILHSELQKIAITDPLTALYNRRGLLELGRHEIDRFQRFEQPLSAIMIDIDHFKLVNDTYGHAAGDQVLCGLADRCSKLIRQVDIIGRYGGEEFAILLPETDLFQASSIAERLRQAVEEGPFYTDQGTVSITVSIGVSRVGRNIASLVALIDQADAALYQAKQKGRNRVEIG